MQLRAKTPSTEFITVVFFAICFFLFYFFMHCRCLRNDTVFNCLIILCTRRITFIRAWYLGVLSQAFVLIKLAVSLKGILRQSEHDMY